jgi:GNAT superfamily N-acetyltransferase
MRSGRSDLRPVRIIDYRPEHHTAFKRINVAWIAERFVVEDVDLDVLDHPREKILDPGGCILLAVEGDAVVGTVALLRSAPGVYQMVKMAVDQPWRGRGIGRLLGEAVIERARQLAASQLMLYSNRAGSVEAIALYRSLGFLERPLPTKAYARADIYMELDLA